MTQPTRRLLMFAFLFIAVCTLSVHAAEPASASEQLHRLLDDEWSARMRDDPLFATQSGVRLYDDRLPVVTPASYDIRAKQDLEFARRLSGIDRKALSPADQTNYDLFEFILKHRNALAPYRAWRIPLTSDEGFHVDVMRMAVGVGMTSVRDYENYISRLRAVPAYFSQQTANLRQGMKDGFTLPAAIVPGIIKVIEGQQYKSATDSPFFEPFTRFPDTISAAEQQRLRTSATAVQANRRRATSDLVPFRRGQVPSRETGPARLSHAPCFAPTPLPVRRPAEEAATPVGRVFASTQ